MKPIKLTLTAFGAYKDTEVIDFRELNGHHLFVISGNTGAGKTTIFDAICFGLYGTASGEDRENTSMLRSHFADDATHTSVDFMFQIKNIIYRVFRQMGHVKAGNKTKTGDKSELYIQTEYGEKPLVDRQISTEVNAKLEQLIGLSEDQFKQIVMLPQGEFYKLLTSETENKEAILRRLFKTEKYKMMNQLLKSKMDLIEQDLMAANQRLIHQVESIQATLPYREGAPVFVLLEREHYHFGQMIAALEEETNYLQDNILANKKQYEITQKSVEHQQQKYHQGVQLNERFAVMEEYVKEFQILTDQTNTYEEYTKKIKAAEQANYLIAYENHQLEREKEQLELYKQVNDCQHTYEIRKKELQDAELYYKKLKDQEDERAELTLNIHRYEAYLPIVKNASQTEQQLQQQFNYLKKTNEKMIEIDRNEMELKKEIEAYKGKIQKQEKEIEPLHRKHIEITQLIEQYRVTETYLESKNQLKQATSDLENMEKKYEHAEREFKEKETLWIGNQALVLAEHLIDGEACPVCGSTHHPVKASAKKQEVTKEQLEVWKNSLEALSTEMTNIRSFQQANQLTLQQAEERVKEYQHAKEVTETTLQELKDSGTRTRTQIKHLESVKEQLQTNKETLLRLEKSIENVINEKKVLESTYRETELDYSKTMAAFESEIKNIPVELRDIKQLQQTVNALKQQNEQNELNWQEAQKQLKAATEVYTTAKTTLQNRHEQLKTAQMQYEHAKATFERKLEEANFTTVSSYHHAKMSEQEQTELQTAIETYKERKTTVSQNLQKLEIELKTKEKVDVAALQASLSKLQDDYEQALTALNQSKNQLDLVHTFIIRMKEAKQASASLEKDFTIMKDLYDMIRGQNPKKISFERYLQIDYLDQIILAANERFKQLMNGQFKLLRSDRQETHGKQSGLAIDVYDGYTGQTRDVKTLSGGEKFIASLCLALGMSDVIQSFQGSISIETMFIDEGFGSLDEESLHRSVDALIQIQKSGRMIGVISHVEELKTIFPAMLKVTKTKEGYSKSEFITY